jgi:integrase
MKQFPWIGQVKVKGKKKSSLQQSRTAALEWEAEQRYRAANPPDSSTKTHSVSLLEWATRYLQYSKKQFVRKTFMEKQKAFKELFKNEEVHPTSSVELLEVDFLIDHLQDQAEIRSGNASNKDRKNLMVAWKWGVSRASKLNLPRQNPFLEVERQSEDRQQRHMPTIEDVLKVIDLAETEQDRLMLSMYLQTGARREELFRLAWDDVDLKEKQIRLYWRKNKRGEWKSEWLPISDELSGLTRAHQKKTGFLKFVFLNMQGSTDSKNWIPYQYRQHWLKNLCEKAGVEKFGFHGMRHLFASTLAARNVPLVEIQYMLRHAHLTTTQRYIRRIKTKNREVIASLPGLQSLKKGPSKGPSKSEFFEITTAN